MAEETTKKRRAYRKRASKDESSMFSFRLPDVLKARIKETAEEHGRSMGEQIIVSVEDGLDIQEAIKDVSAFLQRHASKYRPEDWVPNEGECMTQLLRFVELGIERQDKMMEEAETEDANEED